MTIAAVDLFCGAGGLTFGLERSGINVVEGVDVDTPCKFPYETNTSARFIDRDVRKYTAQDLKRAWGDAEIRILAGCAPCQAFSSYTQGSSRAPGTKWSLLKRFSKLAEESLPDVLTMENVWPLARENVFGNFVQKLESLGYFTTYESIDCREYGMPQSRVRLVLLASRKGPISIIPATHLEESSWATVRKTIGHLPALKAGEQHEDDPIHACSALSERNLKRIRASVPGGTWRDWPKSLVAKCHLKKTGKTYPGVYGRMEWDKPSPTITGQCYGFGNGRFGHPQQDRAISLREAALLQTFPDDYRFTPEGARPMMKVIGRMIGNAVPPRLGEIIGISIKSHLEDLTD